MPPSPSPLPPSGNGRRRAFLGALAGGLFVVQSAWLGIEATPDLVYVGNVFAHFLGGLLLATWFLRLGLGGVRAARRAGSPGALPGAVAILLFTAAVGAGIVLAAVHNTRPHRWILNLHIILASLAVLVTLLALALHARQAPAGPAPRAFRGLAVGAGVATLLAILGPPWGASLERHRYTIENPPRPPFDMAGESMGGAEGPFFPSSAGTSTGGRIPSDFFMTSRACARCHGDIHDQWAASAHHFSSFNNQWYRKTIEYMQDLGLSEASKWCGGCHDHAVLFNGMMDDPVEAFLATPEAHTGLGCNSCHAIARVKDTMGNGGFQLEYPPLHGLAVSDNPVLRWLHDTAVRLDPGPHRKVFLKPFHGGQTAEFCASCHKVHLDVPVNNYRWIRGFNEYDNWQASGVSGQGARSFYYPPEPRDCADCHMPLVPSRDDGNRDGRVHDHSFVAANTALPHANLDEDHLRRTIEFLQNRQVTVDIFAAGPARGPAGGGGGGSPDGPRLASTFAVGEETATAVGRGGGASRELAPVWAPLDRTEVRVRRGEDVRIDVVVRTRGVGHFFPGGTIDAFDVWLELRATDETGRTIFWSGVATDGGAGPVDPGAHFYGVRMVDARGNPIDKRNAWATRAVAWVNLIPPGAADVAHFRLAVPEDCGSVLTLEARLNYRKFSRANTEFAFAGRPAPGEPPGPGPGVDRVTVHWDDREFVTGTVPPDVSAALREIPELPIVVLHRDSAQVTVVDADAEAANTLPPGLPADLFRWNDYGIGLLRQGDFAGARRAFAQVTDIDPAFADGFVNVARVALGEGLLEEAEEAIRRALRIDPDLAKSHYFLGVVLKERGEYDLALQHFREAAARYPRDRVVRNAIARVLFLQRKYEAAMQELRLVLAIDPEDLMAHYNRMLCCRGLGKTEEAEAERRLYERFKADEDAQIILGPFLRENPEDNRMRQPVHEQVDVGPDVRAREIARRERDGEEHVVLPGQAADYARRVVERGLRRIEEGLASRRHRGPTEGGATEPGGVAGRADVARGAGDGTGPEGTR